MSQHHGPAASVTPTQANIFRHGRSLSHQGIGEANGPRYGSYATIKEGQDGRSLANALQFGPRGASLASSAQPPGSFSSDLKTVTLPRAGTPRADLGTFSTGDYFSTEGAASSEQRQKELRDRINKETKIKIGSENLLEALISKNAKQTRDQRHKVESELTSSNRKLLELNSQLEDEIEHSKRPTTPSRDRLSGLFQGSPMKSPVRDSRASQDQFSLIEQESESPTYILAEILQTMEIEGMQPDYYVERANGLVELFKRYPTLKYDLAWPIFGLRVQTMLLSESREVVAAGYRVTRHAIADRGSLQTIRGLNSDNLVILSLVKENKASIEREQGLKFVRAFLDVKDGVREISNAVLRTIVSVAEHHEDRLRNMSLLTVSEILVRDPAAVVKAGGIASLTTALADGSYHGPEGLAMNFLHLLDRPKQRSFLKSGHELDSAFTPFTDPSIAHGQEERLKSCARLLSAILKSWPGLFIASRRDFQAIKSMLQSLQYPVPLAKDLILDLLFDVLHVQPPSWTSSFLAGRRLTTYGRVANLKADNVHLGPKPETEEGINFSLVDHFTALLLGCLMRCGLVQVLSEFVKDADDSRLKRKGTLLLSEVLKLADRCLPSSANANLQVLPSLLRESVDGGIDQGPIATGVIYQMDSVNRTLQRSGLTAKSQQSQSSGSRNPESSNVPRSSEQTKSKLSVDIDELQFRALLLETQVLTTANYLKWKWDLISDLIDGPLLNPKRLEESIKASKFMKRLVGFYRPFKYRFSEARNTKPNQRYVRIGCALIKTLLQSSEGVSYLSESKLLRQLAECLAQLDKRSGLTSASPLFSAFKVSETLTGGYFAILGALSSDPEGIRILERWRMINMCYHIMDLSGRDDLIRALLSNMDFSLDSHLRVMLSKALTACPKIIRIYATRFLRKYATPCYQESSAKPRSDGPEWAIRLLVTQLYDPEVQVCEIAVQILEEVCNRKAQLEYVVRCRPALDHLGAIGAPLLLRFLSTSLGYQYLDGLDYITQEMDDWFLGRNDSYVTIVEASLSRALMAVPERPQSSNDEQMKAQDYGTVPPHFYRELTRTVEGCQLLRYSGHFDTFVVNIQDSWREHDDAETITKLKGSLWAVGNVGSMELGASFLQETDVVDWIIKIATSSKVMTLRGTAFFVLGLISRSLHGMEILTEYGWTAATDHLGRSLGYCLPPELENLLSMDAYELGTSPRESSWPVRHKDSEVDAGAGQAADPIQARILALTADLGNTVITGRAASDLFAIKTKSPESFTSVALFRKVMLILENHSFSLRTRRFVIDLFDKSVMRRIVLDEDSGDESRVSPIRAKLDMRNRTGSDTRNAKAEM